MGRNSLIVSGEMKLSGFLLAGLVAGAPAGQGVVLSGQSTFRPPGAQLISAVEKDKRDEVVSLLTGSTVGYEPVDINSQNYMGRSVLMCAAKQVNIQMVQLLFDTAEENNLEINLDAQDYWGNTVLHMLANAPAKPLKYGERASDWTLKRRFEHAHIIMKSALRHGADPNITNDYNLTPLITAASIGFMDACELLIEAGADINYVPEAVPNRPNRYAGYTPLDIAVSQRNYLESIDRGTFYYDNTIDFLCSRGAQQEKTPDACSGQGTEDIVELENQELENDDVEIENNEDEFENIEIEEKRATLSRPKQNNKSEPSVYDPNDSQHNASNMELPK